MKFVDRAAYDRYQIGYLGVFAQFNGTLLAADGHPQVTEGQTDVEKVVLMSFPDRTTFTAWAESPEYRRISADRHAGAETVVLLVAGIAD
ncbi:MAG: hypothetical protein QOK18_4832 [Mycobacterium sp.]|nr:hypothetical protein [Mycobacterium sp.]MDT7756953.1 hypothetical protein [Mycobacterium sp.]